MILTQLELIDITTHKHTIVHFTRGINVLAGPNGVGKSTLLKMIGFVLFNTLPNSQEDYVRKIGEKPPKKGSVRLTFLADDGQSYLIERGMGAATVKVTHADTQMPLKDIKKMEDLQRFLKEHIFHGMVVDPEILFKNAIGVPQGMFVAPFLDTARHRKDTFNPLLNVDIYQDWWKKYLNVEKEFTDELQDLNLKIARFEGELGQIEAVQTEQTNKQKDLASLDVDIKQTQQKTKQVNAEFLRLGQIKDQITQTENQKKQAELALTNHRDKIKKASEMLQIAQTAKTICDKYQTAYEQYVVIQKDLAQVEQSVTTYQSAKDQLADLDQQLVALKTQQKTLTTQITEISALSQELPGLLEKEAQMDALTTEADKMRAKFNENQEFAKKIPELEANIKRLSTAIGHLEAKLTRLPCVKRWDSALSALKKRMDRDIQKQTTVIAEIKQLEADREQSKDGTCPFLHEMCKNLEGRSLTEYFDAEIARRQPMVSRIQTRITHRSQQIAMAEKAHLELTSLLMQEQKLDHSRTELTTFTTTKQEYESRLQESKNITAQLAGVSAKRDQLKTAIQRLAVVKQKVDIELPKTTASLEQIDKQITSYSVKVTPLQKQVKELFPFVAKRDSLKKSLEGVAEGYNLYNRSVADALRFGQYTDDLKSLQSQEESFATRVRDYDATLHQLATSFDPTHFEQIEQERTTLMHVLGNLTGKRQEITKALEQIRKTLLLFQEKRGQMWEQHHLREYLTKMIQFNSSIRNWIKEALPKITSALQNTVNKVASGIYAQLMDQEGANLIWTEDFDIKIKTIQFEKFFAQLSGGEQMAAALAVRLAILRILTNVDFAFFDEPTSNLDVAKRKNLADAIRNVKGLKQLFVISHDDTFEQTAEHVIRLAKNEQTEETYLDYEG